MSADREMIADLLSALEYHQEQTRPIAMTRTAIAAARHHLRSAAPAAPAAEPDMRHPKIQRLIGSNARKDIEMRLIEQLLEEGPDTDLSSMDMEYWGPTHDKLREALAAAPGAAPAAESPEPLTEALERFRLLELAEEGAREAFGHVVQDKHDAEAECKRLRELLDSAHAQIRRMAHGIGSKP